MQFYYRLPSPDYCWTTPSIDSVRRLRGSKQGVLNQVVLARVELIRLMAFSVIECAIHVAAAGAKFTAVIICFPNPRLTLSEACSHTARATKLATAILCSPLLGLTQPEWSISLYQRLNLVKEPDGIIAKAGKAAWALFNRNNGLFGIALAGAVLIGNRVIRPWKAGSVIHTIPPIVWNISALVIGFSCGAAGLMNSLCSQYYNPANHQQDVLSPSNTNTPASANARVKKGSSSRGTQPQFHIQPSNATKILSPQSGVATVIANQDRKSRTQLPNALVIQIMNCLCAKDIVSMTLVRKQFMHVAIHDGVWKKQCERLGGLSAYQRQIDKLAVGVQNWAYLRLFPTLEKKTPIPWKGSPIPNWPPYTGVLHTTQLSNRSYITSMKQGGHCIWNTNDKQQKYLESRPHSYVLPLPEGRFILAHPEDHNAKIFGTNGSEITQLTRDFKNTKITHLNQGNYAIFAPQDAVGHFFVEKWDNKDQLTSRKHFFHQNMSSHIILQNGNVVTYSFIGGTLNLWSDDNLDPLVILRGVSMRDFTHLADDGFATLTSDGKATLWNADGKLRYTWDTELGDVCGTITESSNGRIIITNFRFGTHRTGETSLSTIWDKGVKIQTVLGHNILIGLPDGSFVAVTDRYQLHHHLPDGSRVNIDSGTGNVRQVFLSPEGIVTADQYSFQPPMLWVHDNRSFSSVASHNPRAAQILAGITTFI